MSATETTNDPLTTEMQIRCAIEEGMENIFRAIFSENLKINTTYSLSTTVVNGVQVAMSRTESMVAATLPYEIEAMVPIMHPNIESVIYRIADTPFRVMANFWGTKFVFEAWCESNTAGGAKVIVRQTNPQTQKDRWLIADSLEQEVLYRGDFDSLFPWAKFVVAKKWPNLPYATLDTELRTMQGWKVVYLDDSPPA